MSEQYLAHVAVIILPLLIVQIWSFRKSFYTLPWRSTLMAVYGAGAAMWNQHYPTHIFGISASFASIPIIISFLYGKRVAGLASAIAFALWTLLMHPPAVYAVIISIVLYSVLPYVLATRFEDLKRKMRLLMVILITFVTIAVQGLLYVLYALTKHPSLYAHSGVLGHVVPTKLLPLLGIAFIVQSIMTIIPMLLMDNVIEDGKMRLRMADDEHRYQSMLEFNPLGIYIFDRENCFVYVNSAYQKITGYTMAELLGISRFDLWFPEDLVYASRIGKTVETGEVLVNIPGALRHRDGGRVDVRFTNVPIFINGTMNGYFSIVDDVTESIRMQKHLRETEKLSLVGQLAASIAHEIRNPLTSLSGFLSLMEEKSVTPEEKSATLTDDANEVGTSQYLKIMKSELHRINLIASQLLMLGKPQLDHFAEHDTRTIVSEVTALLEPQMNMSGIALHVVLPETEVPIWCDKNQIKQALINVIKNAIEAMGTSGSVSVSVEKTENVSAPNVRFVVQDTGPGISPELLQRLGEPFYTTKAEGTGLGLLVTKRIIQSHNGTIAFQSEPGQGTTVTLTFPLAVVSADSVTEATIAMES